MPPFGTEFDKGVLVFGRVSYEIIEPLTLGTFVVVLEQVSH